ncbi:uncharacterized protein BX664DRAFT_142923 [Halteromyces radiatus]|uniref:uncharacterized protein n=1 Tax=Halteromyces radiatus TaxID=101107 RepID=UPI00221ED471|nr:uncharacterized protein BX664DRAFT_142923 [Halteromyces radiatus]KAI8089842.1 hypothetical protein BX664DRAFT_142923 [Halteromyces radiatus]
MAQAKSGSQFLFYGFLLSFLVSLSKTHFLSFLNSTKYTYEVNFTLYLPSVIAVSIPVWIYYAKLLAKRATYYQLGKKRDSVTDKTKETELSSFGHVKNELKNVMYFFTLYLPSAIAVSILVWISFHHSFPLYLSWFICYHVLMLPSAEGIQPTLIVSHKDHQTNNNSIENLESVTPSENIRKSISYYRENPEQRLRMSKPFPAPPTLADSDF